jgi:PAS domain S-box-containing protein
MSGKARTPCSESVAAENVVAGGELAKLLLRSTGEGIYGVDLNGCCTFANPACLRLLGFESDAELLGRNMHELVHHTRPNGEPYPIEECRIYRAFREHQGTHVDEEIMFRKDGASFPAEYWSYPMERDGELVGCVVTFVDISERRRAEQMFAEQAELVRLLLNSTGEGIYGVDMDGNCTFANPACVRLLGFESDAELLGRHMHKLVHHTRPNGEPYPVEECRIYRAFREHQGTHVDDEVMFRKDGTSFPAEYWSYPVERDGELVGCVLTFVDITERRRVEEELRQTEKMAALGKLSAGLAHELNNPAAAATRAAGQLLDGIDALQSATARLAQGGLQPDAWARLSEFRRALGDRSAEPLNLSPLELSDREEELLGWFEAHGVADPWQMAPTLVVAGVRLDDLEAIAAGLPADRLGDAMAWVVAALGLYDLAGTVARSSRSISTLVDAVKSYSYMDRAPVQEVDIHNGIEDTLTILGHKLKRGIEVVREYDRSLPRIHVRSSELNQVWTNLIDNAIAAVGERGTITIRTYRDGDRLAVEIVDDGPGIPEEMQPRIFDPFYTTKEVGQGTGLGLDIVRRIITARCGGEVDFRSRPGGTVFRVRLPLESCAVDT